MDENIQIGDWTLDLAEGRLRNQDTIVELEPKTADVLHFLYQRRGQVVTREMILEAVWPETAVSPGALARSISKLRKALGDDAQSPRYIETLPKRGYRLLEQEPVPLPTPRSSFSVASWFTQIFGVKPPVWMFWVIALFVALEAALLFWIFFLSSNESYDPLLSRADAFYYQYTRSDNESAMALYERVIAESPESAPATLGLANTLVQNVVRWPETLGGAPVKTPTLKDALDTKRTDSPRAQLTLQRAESLALRAVRLDGKNPKAHRTLGLVYASLRRFHEAHRAYDQAIELDPLAWGAMINKSELLGIEGQSEEALAILERAYEAMTEVYDREPVHIRPWYAWLGYDIGSKYAEKGQLEDAEVWFRRVLDHSPFHKETTIDLARLLHAAGDTQRAVELCRDLTSRVGSLPECDVLFEEIQQ